MSKHKTDNRNDPKEGTYFSPGDESPFVYKGYTIKWLKNEVDHPDHYLVAEYETKYGEVK